MKTWVKYIGRALLGLLGLIALAIAAAVGLVIADGAAGRSAADYTNTSFEASDGSAVGAYLTQPEEPGPHPAVLMVHEFWGMNQPITELADRLAEQGYVVLAPDTYRGQTTALVPRALYLRVTVDEGRVDSDMQAAFDYLASLPEVDAGRIGVIGFCYGGGVALRHAIQNPAIRATVNLYGDTPADPVVFGALLGADAGPVLGIFGADDAMIPLADVQAYEAAMTAAGIQNTVTVYPGVGHAFVQPGVIDQPGSSRDAWLDLIAFFDAHLKA